MGKWGPDFFLLLVNSTKTVFPKCDNTLLMLSPMYGSRGDSEEGIVGNPRVIHIITEGACMCTQNRGLRRWAEWVN